MTRTTLDLTQWRHLETSPAQCGHRSCLQECTKMARSERSTARVSHEPPVGAARRIARLSELQSAPCSSSLRMSHLTTEACVPARARPRNRTCTLRSTSNLPSPTTSRGQKRPQVSCALHRRRAHRNLSRAGRSYRPAQRNRRGAKGRVTSHLRRMKERT